MQPAPTSQELILLVRRTEGLQPWRRIFHAASGLVLALVPGAVGWEAPLVVAILAGGLVLMTTFDLARLRSPALNAWFFRAVPSLASPREATRPASSTWYTCGALLTWALFDSAIVVPAVLVLALADPAASVVGRLVRSPRVGTGSAAGGAAFFFVAASALSFHLHWPLAVVIAGVVAAVEMIPWRLDDNLTIPLTAAALIRILGG